MYFPCFQHSSTALNSGEPTGKYSILILSSFLCRYSCNFRSVLCCSIYENDKFFKFLSYLLKICHKGMAIKSNRLYCLNSCCLPSSLIVLQRWWFCCKILWLQLSVSFLVQSTFSLSMNHVQRLIHLVPIHSSLT